MAHPLLSGRNFTEGMAHSIYARKILQVSGKPLHRFLVCGDILTEPNLQSQTTCGEISENAFRFLKCPISFLQGVVPSQAMGRNQTYLTQALVPVMPTALGIARHFWLSPESSLARLPAHCPRINFKSSQSTEYHQLSSFSS